MLCDAQGVRVHPTTTITAITTHPLFPSIPEKYIFTPGALRLCSGPGFSAWRCAQSICFVFRFQSVYRTERWKKCCLEILKSGSGFGFLFFRPFFIYPFLRYLNTWPDTDAAAELPTLSTFVGSWVWMVLVRNLVLEVSFYEFWHQLLFGSLASKSESFLYFFLKKKSPSIAMGVRRHVPSSSKTF